jgi:hypothetical protein
VVWAKLTEGTAIAATTAPTLAVSVVLRWQGADRRQGGRGRGASLKPSVGGNGGAGRRVAKGV